MSSTLDSILGTPLNWSGATVPPREILQGQYVRLEPLDPARHAQQLYQASHGPDANLHLWDYMPYERFTSLDAYTEWLEQVAAKDDPLFFVVVPLRGDGQNTAQGTVALMRTTPEHGSVEVGHVWFGAHLQKTPAATEAIYLLLRQSFDLGFRRVEWKCHNSNAASRRAALRFGFSFEGVFRQHMVIKGRNRDTAWFSLLDTEWSRVRAGFEQWLASENFDESGQQQHSLSSFRSI